MAQQYVSFRGVSTASMTGIIIAQMPSHRKAGQRYVEYKIPARDGSLHMMEGYEPFDTVCKLRLIKQDATAHQTINAWADGTGKLITSDDPSKCWQAMVRDEIVWTRDYAAGKFFDTANIVFHCQPFMHETTESTQTFAATGNIINLGNVVSLPLIQVNGNGTCSLTVGGEEITLTGVVSGTPVFIDCDAAYVYTSAGMTTMTGHFPKIPLGTSQIVVGSGVTSLVITPRWGWV